MEEKEESGLVAPYLRFGYGKFLRWLVWVMVTSRGPEPETYFHHSVSLPLSFIRSDLTLPQLFSEVGES